MGTTDDEMTGSGLVVEIDRLAGEWLAAVLELTFRLASSDEERRDYYRLRYDVIVGRGWAEPEEMPGGLERDAFDSRALHILGWSGGQLAAAARLVLPSSAGPMPTEDVFGIAIEPAGSVANLDRMIVALGFRAGRERAFRALLAACWLELRRRGFTVWCGIDTAAMIRLYRRMGFDVAILAGPRGYWGEQRYAVRFEPALALVALRGRLGGLRERIRVPEMERRDGSSSL